MDDLGIAVLGFFLVFYLCILAICVLMYVLQSVALFKLAKKRGIQNYGLAWVPIGSSWLLGKLADDVNMCRRNKKTNFARNLLALNLTAMGLTVIMYIGVLALSIGIAMKELNPESASTAASVGISFVLFYIAFIAIAIAVSVLTYMALYRVFYGYTEDNAVVFLVLSIFISVLQPIFLFIIRNRELLPPDPTTFAQNYGFPSPPPYAPAPVAEVPAVEKAPAVETPVVETPVVETPAVEDTVVNYENNSDMEDNTNE